MPEPYVPDGSSVTYIVPSLDDLADGPQAFRDFADSIPAALSPLVPIMTRDADITVSEEMVGAYVRMNTQEKDLRVTVPADNTVPLDTGSVIVFANVSTRKDARVTLSPAEGVSLRDSTQRRIERYASAAIIKVDANSWIIQAGSGGGTNPVPDPPVLKTVTAKPGALDITWTAPTDDGGSPLTGYKVEISTDQEEWTGKLFPEPKDLSATIPGLTAGTLYYIRLRASNENGFSDPSNVLSGTPDEVYNNATGGTVTTVTASGKTYRQHAFTSTGTLTVYSSTKPFQVLTAAGGGGGGGSGTYYGKGGGSGGCAITTHTLVNQGYAVNVGAAGPGGGAGGNGGGSGGSSSLAGVVASGGGGFGAGGRDGNGGGGGASGSGGGQNGCGGLGYPPDFGNTGANNCSSLSLPPSWGFSSRSAGGGGGQEPTGQAGGGSGQAGVVAIRYEVAASAEPINEIAENEDDILDVARITRNQNLVVDVIRATQEWIEDNDSDTFFYFKPCLGEDGYIGRIGDSFDLDTGSFIPGGDG